MTEELDPLLADLARLAPAIDAPPEPGSSRHDSILEHAMTATQTVPDPPTIERRRPRRRLVVALSAAAVVALITGIVVAGLGSDPAPASASEALATAAATTGDATTLRIRGTYERPGSTDRITAEADGTDYAITSVGTYADGHEEQGSIVAIGDTVWEDGAKRTDVPPEERNAAFAPSSAAVVEALLDGSTLQDLGDEDLDGVSARHIRATLTDRSRAALRALSPSQVAMFELEYPDGVDTVDVWIADDLIRKIELTVDEGGGEGGEPQQNHATIEFSDFGADITIAPPS